MKRILIIILALLITGLAGGYEYRMPVNIQSSTTPAVLMPGDEAILAIQMQNGAAAYGVGKDAGVSSPSPTVLSSTPINRTPQYSDQGRSFCGEHGHHRLNLFLSIHDPFQGHR